jgi:hypothetical protein
VTENVPTLASAEVPPVDVPPVDVPPVDVPPVDVPPVDVPPVDVPPVDVPPVEVPPVEVPPVEVPPVVVPASPPLAFGDAPSDEHPHDEARTIEETRVLKTGEFIVERLFNADVPISIEPGSRHRHRPDVELRTSVSAPRMRPRLLDP